MPGNANAAQTYYYFFYNWDVELPGCESPRTAANVEVIDDFNLDIINAPEYTCDFQTAIQLSSNVSNGNWSADCTDCIDSITGLFDPNQAGIGVWTISYTAINICEKTVDIIIPVETCLSIKENTISPVFIYPNPGLTNVTISLNSKNVKTILMTDVSGKVISQFGVNSDQIDINVSHFENGLYLFNFLNKNGEKLAVEKFIKH